VNCRRGLYQRSAGNAPGDERPEEDALVQAAEVWDSMHFGSKQLFANTRSLLILGVQCHLLFCIHIDISM